MPICSNALLTLTLRTSEGTVRFTPIGEYEASEETCTAIRRIACSLMAHPELESLDPIERERIAALCLPLSKFPIAYKGCDQWVSLTGDTLRGRERLFIRMKNGLLLIHEECTYPGHSDGSPATILDLSEPEDEKFPLSYRVSTWEGDRNVPLRDCDRNQLLNRFRRANEFAWIIKAGDLSFCDRRRTTTRERLIFNFRKLCRDPRRLEGFFRTSVRLPKPSRMRPEESAAIFD